MTDKLIDILDTIAIYDGWISGTIEGMIIRYATKFKMWFEKERELCLRK